MPGGDAIPYILATAGHVDHGKSALVKVLTGTDPDRLPEEKARGLTIELGFASLRLGSPPEVSPVVEYQIGVIDVPGHEDFVRNMVAGVGSIDAALLVVAADDGWMPQTEEHFQILAHLGVTRGVVALSKIDLAADESLSIGAVRDRLRSTPFENAPIVPTSIVSRRGIGELKLALARALADAPPQPDLGKPRLPVDRVFIMKGVGVVVTGTLTGGTLRRGQAVVVQPSQTSARIRTMQTYSQEVEMAQPGSRVALNLPDLHAATRRGTRTADSIARGDVVTIASLGAATRCLDVAMAASRTIRDKTIVQVHHGAAAIGARIQFLESTSARLARLTLDDPLFAVAGDRFIVRDWSEQQTLGGGIVLDAHPPPAIRRRSPARSRQLVLLEARDQAPNDPTVFVATQLERDRMTPRQSLIQSSRFSSAQIDSVALDLASDGSIAAIGDWLVATATLRELCARIVIAVDAHHHSHPEQSGYPLAEVKSIAAALRSANTDTFVPILVDAVIAELSRAGFQRTGTVLRRTSHRPALPPRLQAAGEALRRQLAAHPLDPPSRKELCLTDVSHQALKFLIATGEAVQINPELVLGAEAYLRAIDTIREHLQSKGPATVSELKTRLGTSRRVMVPLLEKLDRDGITLREGDCRRLHPTPRDPAGGLHR